MVPTIMAIARTILPRVKLRDSNSHSQAPCNKYTKHHSTRLAIKCKVMKGTEPSLHYSPNMTSLLLRPLCHLAGTIYTKSRNKQHRNYHKSPQVTKAQTTKTHHKIHILINLHQLCYLAQIYPLLHIRHTSLPQIYRSGALKSASREL